VYSAGKSNVSFALSESSLGIISYGVITSIAFLRSFSSFCSIHTINIAYGLAGPPPVKSGVPIDDERGKRRRR
jgi:hypothetical protein